MTTATRRFRSALLAGTALLCLAATANARTLTPTQDTYLPPGALSYDEERLPNGLRIVTQEVHSAPYISARLLVHVGTDYFPCADRELPHLVEHLLFSANASLAENEIDDRIADWGGAVNAFTYPEDTVVVLDVHARFQEDALPLMATLIGDFSPTADNIEREKNVVEHESGTVQTPLRLWWSQQPFTQRAETRFDIAAGMLCSAGITPIHHLALADVQQAYANWYVPANMILVLVGDLSPEGRDAARAAFSALPAQPAPKPVPARIAMPTDTEFASGWLSGVSQQDAPTAIGIAPFRDWEGYYALQLVEAWLRDRMFRELRSERGIAYTPDALFNYEGTALSIALRVQTDPADTAFVESYLRRLVDDVRTQGIPEEDFERLRTSTLLGMAQAFERIADRADYIAGSWRELESGALFNSETFYRDLDYLRFSELVARDWPARFVVFDNSARLSWSMVTGLLIGSCILLVVGVTLFVWRRLRRLQSMG